MEEEASSGSRSLCWARSAAASRSLQRLATSSSRYVSYPDRAISIDIMTSKLASRNDDAHGVTASLGDDDELATESAHDLTHEIERLVGRRARRDIRAEDDDRTTEIVGGRLDPNDRRVSFVLAHDLRDAERDVREDPTQLAGWGRDARRVSET